MRKPEAHDKAISDYTKAIQLNPKDPDTYCNRGVSYYRKNDYEGD
jgi:Flp pilus assembly protein TadD